MGESKTSKISREQSSEMTANLFRNNWKHYFLNKNTNTCVWNHKYLNEATDIIMQECSGH